MKEGSEEGKEESSSIKEKKDTKKKKAAPVDPNQPTKRVHRVQLKSSVISTLGMTEEEFQSSKRMYV